MDLLVFNLTFTHENLHIFDQFVLLIYSNDSDLALSLRPNGSLKKAVSQCSRVLLANELTGKLLLGELVVSSEAMTEPYSVNKNCSNITGFYSSHSL